MARRSSGRRSSKTRTIVVRTRGRISRAYRGTPQKQLIGFIVGGLAMGFLDKEASTLNIPTIPILGRKGTIALAMHYLGGKGKPGVMTDIRNAAAVMAAYEFGSTGKVSGEEGEI